MITTPSGQEDGNQAERHKVLVVDDHPLFRKGVTQLLAMEPSIEVVGEAGTQAEALELARRTEPDLILLDLNLKGESGLDVLTALKEEDPARRVVILTVSDSPDDLVSTIRAGADGYLLKDMEPQDMLDRVRDALQGATVLSDALAALLAHSIRDEGRADATESGAAPKPRSTQELTERELAVLRCIADGMSNKRIARALEITEGTVKVHVKHVLKKLAFRSRVEAAVWAAEQGLRMESPTGS
jgi:two-component system nitrate/nitrite response regulator NarL